MKKVTMKCAILMVGCLCLLAQATRAADALDSWTTNNTTIAGTVSKVAFGNGTFVAVGPVYAADGSNTGATIATSTDGATWTSENTSAIKQGLFGVTYANGQFVAVGGRGANVGVGDAPLILISPDGAAWTAQDPGVTNRLEAITYGNGLYVATGDRGTIVTSPDGVTWTPRELKIEIQTGFYLTPPPMTGVAYGNGIFVAVGTQRLTAPQTVTATSRDGITWTDDQTGTPTVAGYCRSIVFANGQFVAVGGYNQQTHSTSTNHFLIYSSKDGLNWTQRQDLTPAFAGYPGFMDVAYGSGQFMAVEALGLESHSYSSSDGANWVQRPLYNATTVGFGNGRFVAFAGNQAIHSGDIGKLGASLTPSGQLDGTITGVTGQLYAIQASLNLQNWGVLTNVSVTTDGIASFTDTLPSPTGKRFYLGSLVQ